MNLASLVKTGPTKNPPRIAIIGVEGVGKSTAGAQMPNPIFLCAEDGLVGKQFEGVANASPATWTDTLAFLDILANETHDYKTLVVDTVDWLEPKLYAFICDRDSTKDKKLTSVEDYGYGKGYVVACNEFRGLLAKLEILNRKGMGIVILAHSQIKAFNNPTGENYDRYELKVAKQIGSLTKEWVDAVLFARFETYTKKDGLKAKGMGGANRVVHTSHCAGWDAKNRYSLPELLPFDMPLIMEEIKKGQPASADELISEIKSLIPAMTEDQQAKTTAWLANPQTIPVLVMFLNKIRTTTSQTQE